MFDKARRDQILATVIAPAEVSDFEATLDEAYTPQFNKNVGLNDDGSAPQGYIFVSRTTPIGTKTTQSSDTTATVEVWCGGLLGLAGENSTNPVTSSWFTITMKLEWTGGDWKIVSHSQKDGPRPSRATTGPPAPTTSRRLSRSTEGSRMPANHRVLKLAAVAGTVQASAVLLATRAVAAPTPSPSPSSSDNHCSLIHGPARNYCESGTKGSGKSGLTTDPGTASTLDPLSSLANGCADAASWTIDKLSAAVNDTANVDFTNPKFLQQYAVVFAASSILTLLLWLLAVTKRAVRGVPSARPSPRRSGSSG